MTEGSGTRSRSIFLAGLLLTTLATLTLEILDTRLLSVITWYHLSFFAVSVAMLGMTAGAVYVYLGGARFEGRNSLRALARYSTWFALSIPVSHIGNLVVPMPNGVCASSLAALVFTTVFLAAPFFFSGVVVAVALTRVPGRVGLVYSADLVGAALGCLLVLGLLSVGNITTVAFASGVAAALGALAFRVFARERGGARDAVLALALIALAFANSASTRGFRLVFTKGTDLAYWEVTHESWSIHGQVLALQSKRDMPWYWGAGKGAERFSVESTLMLIDGGAGTSMTRWDGNTGNLGWTSYDVTSLPYHLRRGGDVAIIGVGGGRDVLTALWAGSRSVTGIEISQALVDLLQRGMRDYAHIAQQPGVTLVRDEARSYLTREPRSFDVLQMSLIDTWAATGAGAFTLSENGLYTTEAWDVFLARLKPDGIFSVSRWFTPEKASETSRLVSLATESLIRHRLDPPAAHLVLASRENVATLMVKKTPFSAAELARLEAVADAMGFTFLLLPGHPAGEPLLGRIAACRTSAELLATVGHEPFDYTPPSDERPYFFNLIRPSTLLDPRRTAKTQGVIGGNMYATATLLALFAIVLALVVTTILLPLRRLGLPAMDGGTFAWALGWFGLIGIGYMFVQIGLVQRFSVYLGHPVYAVAVILFTMILCSGIGSFCSDYLPVERRRWTALAAPAAAALAILATSLLVAPVVRGTIGEGIVTRCLIVIATVAPVSFLLGFLFPTGMRLVGRIAPVAQPWMWGVNGACGVLASVAAIGISMWVGISATLFAAAVAYAVLLVPGALLWGRGAVAGER